MKAIVTSLLAIVFASAAVAGDILVYSGTCVETDPGQSVAPITKRVFVVIDVAVDVTALSKGTVAILTYGKEKGMKRYEDLTYPMRSTLVVRPDSKLASSFTVAKILDDPAEAVIYAHDLLFLRGVQTPLLIEVFGEDKRYSSQPKVLTGSGYFAGSAPFVSRITQRNFVLKYDQARSLVANAGNQAVPQVLADLINYVKSLGYSL